MRPTLAVALVPMVVAWCAPGASADQRWRLEFQAESPQLISIESPGGEPKSFWYFRYTLKNPGEKPVTSRVDIRIATDTPYSFRDAFQPIVQEAIERRYGKKFLSILDVARTEIAPGATVDAVAIFDIHEFSDLRLLFRAMNAFTTRDEKTGKELLEEAARRYPEGPHIAIVKELQAAAGEGLEAARAKTLEISGRWSALKKATLPEGVAEGEIKLADDLALLTSAVHDLRLHEFDPALEKLTKLAAEFPQSRWKRTADNFRLLARSRRIPELTQALDDWLTADHTGPLKEEADRLELHITGLYDVVCPEADAVYVETKVLKIVYAKPGDEHWPSLAPFKKTSETWYVEEGSRKFLRKVYEPRNKKG